MQKSDVNTFLIFNTNSGEVIFNVFFSEHKTESCFSISEIRELFSGRKKIIAIASFWLFFLLQSNESVVGWFSIKMLGQFPPLSCSKIFLLFKNKMNSGQTLFYFVHSNLAEVCLKVCNFLARSYQLFFAWGAGFDFPEEMKHAKYIFEIIIWW